MCGQSSGIEVWLVVPDADGDDGFIAQQCTLGTMLGVLSALGQ
jgi:hypothetical protein